MIPFKCVDTHQLIFGKQKFYAGTVFMGARDSVVG
jgi:hypothetical protein